MFNKKYNKTTTQPEQTYFKTNVYRTIYLSAQDGEKKFTRESKKIDREKKKSVQEMVIQVRTVTKMSEHGGDKSKLFKSL